MEFFSGLDPEELLLDPTLLQGLVTHMNGLVRAPVVRDAAATSRDDDVTVDCCVKSHRTVNGVRYQMFDTALVVHSVQSSAGV